MEEIQAITMPGTHSRFFEYFKSKNHPTSLRILDVGAGHGAFTKKLFEEGYKVQACDLFPEEFQYKEVVCDKVDITKKFPYEDNSFDIVIAIEVTEHILDHEVFFSELNRIIKPSGCFYISTPNILSLKSRIRFFSIGFPYSFRELEKGNYNGLQHVASLTYDQYHYLAVKFGFLKPLVDVDKIQGSSFWLMVFLFPFIYIYTFLKKAPKLHNTRKLLLGRLLFLCFQNNKGIQS
jgi:SAM-dependent methyltransferase